MTHILNAIINGAAQLVCAILIVSVLVLLVSLIVMVARSIWEETRR